MLAWALGYVACAEPTTGAVTSAVGTPVAGASLTAPDCTAVTGADGAFVVQCPDGPRTFLVSHPAYLPRRVDWASGPVAAVLTPIPTEPGVFVTQGDALAPLAASALERRGDDTNGWSFCIPADAPPAAVTVPAGELQLLDNHDVDWRLFPVDADGCAYALQHANGEWWTSPSKAIPVEKDHELAPGRSWLKVTLASGRYALVDWYAGTPIPDPAGGYRARLLTVR